MRVLTPWRKSLREILSVTGFTAEQLVAAEIVARPIIHFREHPNVALVVLSGIVIPPTQRLMTNQAFQGAAENINVSSRGTSKTTAVCVFNAALLGILYSKKRIIELSATGFRGGQNIFNDLERWALGKFDSQEADVGFIEDSVERNKNTPSLVHRAQNYWQITLESDSLLRTLPTNDEDRIRGERAHIVFIDEANTTPDTLISKVVQPFLVVKGGFDTGGAESASNQAFYTSTIDYQWRPFVSTVRAARDGVRRDYEALAAARRKDWETYAALAKQGILQYTHTSFDYSDTIIRERIVDRAGKTWRVRYPNANLLMGRPELYFRDMPEGIPFTERDADGRIRREGSGIRGLTTYPIDKDGIERGLYSGATEESIWLAEQKNVVDTAAGDVYPHGLMDRVASVGSNCIVPWQDCGRPWQEKYANEPDRGFAAPILHDCDDPCVLGVDVANSSRDFAAFCVIRIGPLSEGPFNPLGTRALGQTPWSNVIWQEQHRMLSYKEIADKVRQMRRRYNLVWEYEPWKEDWEWCRAIGIDDRGGGSAVRDELLFLDKDLSDLPDGEYRLFDPLDKEEKVGAVKQDWRNLRALPLLDMIAAQDTTNDKLVEFTLGLMKVGKFYLPKWLDESRRPDRDSKLNPAYDGVRILEHQLRTLQQEPTARARRFFMPGDADAVKNKRDAWASFIYAAKQLRAHLLRAQVITKRPPAQGAVVTQINSQRGQHGRSPGARF